MRILKAFGITAAAIASLAALFLIVIFLAGDRTYRSLVVHAVEHVTDREMTIEGAFRVVSLAPVLQVQAGGVKLTNAPWSERPYLAEVGWLDARVDIFGLFDGILDLALSVEDSLFSVERHVTGESN